MAKMTIARARSLIGKAVLAQLDREPDPRDTPDEAARTLIIGWLVAALDAGQLKEIAALLATDFLSWPAMRKGTLAGPFPGYRAGVPPTVPRTVRDDGRHLTARTLHVPEEISTGAFREEALNWPLPPMVPGRDELADRTATRDALLNCLATVTEGQTERTPDELKALIQLIATRLHEVGLQIIAIHDDVGEGFEEGGGGEGPDPGPEDPEIPF
jgi:hypothetical protein